jgi:hypothetical protein
MKLLSDRDERKRSTASASLKAIMEHTEEPALLLKTLLDSALSGSLGVPNSPAAIQPSEAEGKLAAERATKLVESWATAAKGTMMLDPVPVLERLWADPKNDIIVGFIAKSIPLYDTNRLLTVVMDQLRKPKGDLFEQLAPLLVLRPQSFDFFTQREVVASPLFDLICAPDEPDQQLRRVRSEICARFPVSFVIPRMLEIGVFSKFCLHTVLICATIHQTKLPEVCDLFEENFASLASDIFIPVCDTFYFADRERCLRFAIAQDGSPAGLTLLHTAFQKFEQKEAVEFIQKGFLSKVLRTQFKEPETALAVSNLAVFASKAKGYELDSYWEELFEIASHYSDSRTGEWRFCALKLTAALLVNASLDNHFPGNVARLEHMLTMASNDAEVAKTRELANGLLEHLPPRPWS